MSIYEIKGATPVKIKLSQFLTLNNTRNTLTLNNTCNSPKISLTLISQKVNSAELTKLS